MKKHILLVSLAFIFSGPALGQDMKTIDDFLEDNIKSENGSTEVFVGLRCSSIYFMMHSYFDGQKEYAGQFEGLSGLAFEFARRNQDPKEEEFLTNQFMTMIEGYKGRWLKAKAYSGNFNDDVVISRDIATCRSVFIAD